MDDQTKRPSQPPDRGKLKRFLFGVLIVLFGGFMLGDLANRVTQSVPPGTELIRSLVEFREILRAWNTLTLSVINMLVIGTHEIGHLLGSISQQMKFALLIVGPFG